ncbi:MAG: HAMP domain-containing histidine kinase, partial [Proteobacteria bacterium]|nr:HAMP domain-containing histidine kinase [Pseudomonadota bacterium]
LRTPLNTVIGFSKLLADHDRRPLPETDVVEYARLIHDASCNLLSIINDILDISKMQSGQLRLDTTDVNIDEIIEIVASGFRSIAQQAGATLTLELGDEPLLVKGDQNKLRQVLTNIIGNAIKFTTGDGQVVITCSRERDGAVLVAVKDNGIGMDEEEVSVALAPFGQVDGARTRWREGTGLGLPIAKALVELHSGRLDIQSQKGNGTTVTLHFPPPSLMNFIKQDTSLPFAR